MMKTILVLSLLFFLFSTVSADQRFETTGGFCHFVLDTNNDDNEVFFANCENTIIQNDDGTATGSTRVNVTHVLGAQPITDDRAMTGEGTGIPCVMVDSNGTEYVTYTWRSNYTFERFDFANASVNVLYVLACYEGIQQ